MLALILAAVSSAAMFLLAAFVAAVVGSVVVWALHRVRTPKSPDFNDSLRALAPRNGPPQARGSSGIVRVERRADEEN